MKKVLMLLIGVGIAWWGMVFAGSHLWFTTAGSDSVLPGTTTTILEWDGLQRLRECTFIYDMNNADTKLAMDTSRIIFSFNDDTFSTTWDTVFYFFSGALADEWVPGMFRLWDYDTTQGVISGRLCADVTILESFDIGIWNGGDSVATFKVGIIWEDVYTR